MGHMMVTAIFHLQKIIKKLQETTFLEKLHYMNQIKIIMTEWSKI